MGLGSHQTQDGCMLVLSRKRDEQILIGDDIVITVVEIRGDKVRLGIEAPAHVPVHRSEVYAAITANNRKNEQPPSTSSNNSETTTET
jgi:carbon storage regulator